MNAQCKAVCYLDYKGNYAFSNNASHIHNANICGVFYCMEISILLHLWTRHDIVYPKTNVYILKL